MATFLENEINATDRDVRGPTEQVQNLHLHNLHERLKPRRLYLIIT